MILIHLPISIILSIIVPIYPLVKLFKVGTNDMNSLGRVMNFPCLLRAEKKVGKNNSEEKDHLSRCLWARSVGLSCY